MGVGGVPPISGGGAMQPIEPSEQDQQLINQLQVLLGNFQKAWSAYEKDPSATTEKGLENVFSHLIQFLDDHQSQIDQICQGNGWKGGGPGGYLTNVEGSLNNSRSMIMPAWRPPSS